MLAKANKFQQNHTKSKSKSTKSHLLIVHVYRKTIKQKKWQHKFVLKFKN